MRYPRNRGARARQCRSRKKIGTERPGRQGRPLKKTKYTATDDEHGNNLLRYPFPSSLTGTGQIERALIRWMNTFHLMPTERFSDSQSAFNKELPIQTQLEARRGGGERKRERNRRVSLLLSFDTCDISFSDIMLVKRPT